MRNYIILNGVNSNTITGLLISTLPPITKPKIRTQTEEIDGRDGDIVTKLGYSAYDKEFEIGLYGDFDINEVISYFNSEGTVVFSNEEDKYYNYQILDQIDYEKLIRFKTATIRMHVQPFKYPLEEEQIQVDATVVEAEGSNISLQYTNPNHTITSELKGDLYQETTTGKNLYTVETGTSSRVGVDATYNKSEFTLNGTTTSGGNIFYDSSISINTGYRKSQRLVAGKYTITIMTTGSINFPSGTGLAFYLRDANTNVIIGISSLNKSFQFTLAEDTDIYSQIYCNASGINFNNVLFKVQIEKGSTATPYEEYTGGVPSPNPDYPQEIEVVTGQQEINIVGKNLLPNNNITQTINGITFTKNDNGSITLSGTSNAVADYYLVGSASQYIDLGLSTTTYNLNGINNGSLSTYVLYAVVNRNGNLSYYQSINKTGLNISVQSGDTFRIFIRVLNNQTVNTTIYPQLEKGTDATDYQVYQSQSYTIDLGTTELYGIPDTTYRDRVYQDNNTWYIERQVAKVVLNGSENWTFSNWGSNPYKRCSLTIDNLITTIPDNQMSLICSLYFKAGIYNQGVVNTITSRYNNSQLNIFQNVAITNNAEWKNWLSTHNTTVYYVLNTPTTEEITDTDLLAQLNELQEATTYENTTNISVTGNLPVILKATTSGMPNTVINNIGNIYAKPLITIYGSGTIGVYLNQIQVLQIDLGNNGSITIDVSKMEAYNNSTKALMNRLVTGDYMKFLINSGENNIAFSGNVAGFTMDNYTRWL